jgi:N-acetylmuramoyl-L-alanine amidase
MGRIAMFFFLLSDLVASNRAVANRVIASPAIANPASVCEAIRNAAIGRETVAPADSVWWGRTTGKMPYMEYGIGDDRLGGAKMGLLDSNVLVKVVDSFHTQYKIQLSQHHAAYIEKANVLLVSKQVVVTSPHNSHLSGHMKVYGDADYDYVDINLDERLPYRAVQSIEPSRVVLDIFGVTSNTNWIMQLRSVKEIRNTWYEQVEDDVFRVVIELKHAQHWGFSSSYDSAGKKLTIRIKRQPAVLDIRRLRIAIDAGHGGDNIGAGVVNSGPGTAGAGSAAVNGNGTKGGENVLEKNYTLLIAEELAKTLKKAGVKQVFMTRTKDTTLSMPERVALLRQFNPSLLVSIHLNSSTSDTIQGVSTYYRYIGFRSLSEAILRQMLTLGLKEYGNVGSFNFALSGPTDYPNALVEAAFLSNPSDEKKVLNSKFRKAMAQKIYLGILDWLKAVKP